MPAYQQHAPGGDEVRGRDGTTCRQGTHPGPVVDVGGMAGNEPVGYGYGIYNNVGNNGNYSPPLMGGAYARVIIPLEVKEISRVDCNRLYDLEVERLQLEIEHLKKNGAGTVEVE